jgi:hypothetical protein
MNKPKLDQKARVIIDFGDVPGCLEFLDELINAGLMPDDVGLFMTDQLDYNVKSSNIIGSNEFIVKRIGDRPFQLKRGRTTIEVEGL